MLTISALTIRHTETSRCIDSVLELLRAHGFAIVTEYRDDVAADATEFDALLARASASESGSTLQSEHQKNLHEGYSTTPTGVHLKLGDPASIADSAPRLSAAFASPFVRDVSERHFAGPVTNARHIILTWDTGPSDGIVPFHFDEIRSLKFFLYLSDPRDGGGAIELIPGTAHASRRAREMEWSRVDSYEQIVNRVIDARSDEWLYTLYGAVRPVLLLDAVLCAVPAGSLVVFDTDVLHRGGALAAGRERKVARASSYAGFMP